MVTLMKLEMRKFRFIGSYIPMALIANAVILVISSMIGSITEIKLELSLTTYTAMFGIIDTLVRATYIVFASVLLSKLVISEFRSKSIMVLFMYPIHRKKLMMAKLLVVVLFTFIAVITANVFACTGFYIINQFMPIIDEPLPWSAAAESLLAIVMSAVATSFLSLIPLYFGMRKYSVPATIVSSLLVAAMVCQNVDGFSLYSIIAVPISLALVGAAVSYWSIRNIDQADVFTK